MTVSKLYLHCALYGLVLGALNWTYQKTEVLELSRATASVDAVLVFGVVSILLYQIFSRLEGERTQVVVERTAHAVIAPA